MSCHYSKLHIQLIRCCILKETKCFTIRCDTSHKRTCSDHTDTHTRPTQPWLLDLNIQFAFLFKFQFWLCVCMCGVCVCACVYVHIYINIYEEIYIYTPVNMYVCNFFVWMWKALKEKRAYLILPFSCSHSSTGLVYLKGIFLLAIW